MFKVSCAFVVCPFRRPPFGRGPRAAILLIVLVLSATGCVRRRLNVRTNPPGALVYVDNQQIGTTPCSVDFTYYGTREIRLVKPGYETLTVNQPIPTPWYEYIPLDFVSENLVPTRIRDNRTVTYDLCRKQSCHRSSWSIAPTSCGKTPCNFPSCRLVQRFRLAHRRSPREHRLSPLARHPSLRRQRPSRNVCRISTPTRCSRSFPAQRPSSCRRPRDRCNAELLSQRRPPYFTLLGFTAPLINRPGSVATLSRKIRAFTSTGFKYIVIS